MIKLLLFQGRRKKKAEPEGSAFSEDDFTGSFPDWSVIGFLIV